MTSLYRPIRSWFLFLTLAHWVPTLFVAALLMATLAACSGGYIDATEQPLHEEAPADTSASPTPERVASTSTPERGAATPKSADAPPVSTPETTPESMSAPDLGPVKTDREALVALYNATGGDNWYCNDNWLSDKPLSTWCNVETDDEGRVVALYLIQNNLSGEIPSELGDLASLEKLDLSLNQLTGEIPGELGSLSNLTALAVQGNELEGDIPVELAGLSNLRFLFLDDSGLSGCAPSGLRDQLDMDASKLGYVVFCSDDATTTSTPAPQPTATPTSTVPPTPDPTLIDFPWQKDGLGLTREEHYTLQVLYTIQKEHQHIFDDVLALPWLADGITSPEWGALSALSSISYQDTSISEWVVGSDWFLDGITSAEDFALSHFSAIIFYNPDLANTLMDFPWFLDGVSSEEVDALAEFRNLSEDEVYASALERVLRFPIWLTDNVDGRHARVLGAVEHLVRIDRDLVDSILDTDIFDEPIEFFHRIAIIKLPRIVENRAWNHIANQPWFRDGLTEEELILISMAYNISHDEMQFQELIEGASIRSEHYISSVGPPVKLIAVSMSQTQTDEAFEYLYNGVAEMEALLGIPWQNSLGSDVPYAGVFIHKKAGSPRLRGEGVLLVPPPGRTIYHELGHAFFSQSDFPKWVSEGVAEFFEEYTAQLHRGRPIHTFDHPSIGRVCPGISNISESIEFHEARLKAGQGVRGDQDCAYTLGKSFFLAMYQYLGHDVASSQLRGLVLEGLHSPERLTEAEIYNLLLSNTPAEKQDEFRDLYRRLHGGPIPDS